MIDDCANMRQVASLNLQAHISAHTMETLIEKMEAMQNKMSGSYSKLRGDAEAENQRVASLSKKKRLAAWEEKIEKVCITACFHFHVSPLDVAYLSSYHCTWRPLEEQ